MDKSRPFSGPLSPSKRLTGAWTDYEKQITYKELSPKEKAIHRYLSWVTDEEARSKVPPPVHTQGLFTLFGRGLVIGSELLTLMNKIFYIWTSGSLSHNQWCLSVTLQVSLNPCGPADRSSVKQESSKFAFFLKILCFYLFSSSQRVARVYPGLQGLSGGIDKWERVQTWEVAWIQMHCSDYLIHF